MDYIKDTFKGAIALSLVAALVTAAIIFLIIIGVATAAFFAVLFPLALLTRAWVVGIDNRVSAKIYDFIGKRKASK